MFGCKLLGVLTLRCTRLRRYCGGEAALFLLVELVRSGCEAIVALPLSYLKPSPYVPLCE